MNILRTLSTLSTLSPLGNAGAVANARRGAELQHRHELAALELALRLVRHERVAVEADHPARVA